MTVLVSNKKAGFNYEFLEKMEAGIELLGFEVKALKDGKGSLDGSYIVIRGAEAFITNFNVSPYQPGNTPKDYDPKRLKKLLLTKKEISYLVGMERQKGLTIVPISVYTKGKKVKVSLAVSRGKKNFDKRESIKKRDTERDVRRDLRDH